MPTNNNRADRGTNRKTGNAPKITAEQKRTNLAKQLKLTKGEKKLVDELISNKKLSATEAYIRTHTTNNRAAAAVEASKALKKPNVAIYMDSAVRKAKERIVTLVDSENESIAIKASQDIIDRTEGKATQRNETLVKTVEVKLDLTGVKLGNHYLTTRQLDDAV